MLIRMTHLRLTFLLLLAAVLIGVAALLAPAARPAEAQSPIWSATLTVEGPTVLGCAAAHACAAALTDNTFVHGGVEYTVETVTLIGDSLIMSFDIALPTSLTYVRLQVGSVQLGNGDFASTNITWAGTALSWTAGQQVRLRLLPPAPDDWRSWNPTVTVADVGAGSFGCATTPPCSTALTDDGFVHGGVPYKVTQITLTSGGALTVTFDKNLPSSLNNASAQVGSAQLSGAVRSSKSLRWSNTGLSWSAGDRVRLRLIGAPPAAPTGLSVGPGNSTDTIAAAWTAPDDTLTARITGYEVRYKGIYARNAEASTAGDPNTGWVTKRLGRSTRTTLNAVWTPGGTKVNGMWPGSPFVVQVRSLSASGPSAWSAQVQGSPKPPPGGTAATPLQILSGSRTSVREGDAPITITARLAQPAPTGGVVIPISHEQMHGKTPPHGLELAKLATACDDPNNAEKDYTFAPAEITIAEGQRTGQATLTVCDDNVEDTNEYIYLHPGNIPNEAYPSGDATYQIQSLRITILNDETGPGGTGPDPVEPRPTPTPQPQQQPTPTPTPQPQQQQPTPTPQPQQQQARPECEAETGPLCGITLSAGSESVELSPDFAPDTTAYRATVPAGTTSLTLTPTWGGESSVFVGSRNGGTSYIRPTRVRPSGTAVELALAPDGGATELWLMVSGSGGMTTYSIHVTEARPGPKTYSVSATSTAAEGANATLTVTLSEAAPTGGAAFTVTAGYGGGSTATSDDVGSITSPVTVAEGDTTLDITIPTADDAVDEDDETFTVTVAATTSGWEKEGDGKDAATITITDDDTAGVTVTPTTLSISEDGSGSYTVVLDSRPTADVTVTPTSGDGGAAGVAPASHTFTPSDWNTPQTFTVSGVADEDRDNEAVAISNSATSSDGKYGGISVASVSVSVTDTTPEPQQQQQATTSCPEETEPPVPGQTEPYNICVTPGDGTLTVTWTVAPREGFEDVEIRHALRWSQEPGVWANPRDPNAVGANDGISVAGGVYTYTITGLENGVATGVFVRSFTGGDYNEGSAQSSKWVRLKGENTTPQEGL